MLKKAMQLIGGHMLNRLKGLFIEETLNRVRAEYTVMPRFGFHQPLDYLPLTLPPSFETPTQDSTTGLLIPTGADRFGYSPEDTNKYLAWGKYDHDQLIRVIEKHSLMRDEMSILDFGCSSGRVLRHFEAECKDRKWKLYGCDIQARAIQWIRQYLPKHFIVVNTSTLPHLPFEDRTFDFIYGISVFTHTKYQWDAWFMELKRVMKPGGLMVQTIHTENAWRFYAGHKQENWVRENHCARVYENSEMDVDFLYYGDACISQVFWKKRIAEAYWGRYFDVLEIRDPPEYSFQDWGIGRKT
jgi:SAM-dependent methyltransferase